MLSKGTLRALKFFIKTTAKLKVLPYEWDENREGVKVTRRTGQIFMWIFTTFFVSLESCYQAFTIYKELDNPGVPFNLYLKL